MSDLDIWCDVVRLLLFDQEFPEQQVRSLFRFVFKNLEFLSISSVEIFHQVLDMEYLSPEAKLGCILDTLPLMTTNGRAEYCLTGKSFSDLRCNMYRFIRNEAFRAAKPILLLLSSHLATSQESDDPRRAFEILTTRLLSNSECILLAVDITSQERGEGLIAAMMLLMKGIWGLSVGHWDLDNQLWKDWVEVMHDKFTSTDPILQHNGDPDNVPPPFKRLKDQLCQVIMSGDAHGCSLPIARIVCEFLAI